MLASKSPVELAETEAKPLALRWVASAIAALDHFDRRDGAPVPELLLAALHVNFAWARVPLGERLERARRIKATYAMIQEMLRLSAHRFKGASEAELLHFFPDPATTPPSFTRFGRFILFTPAFQPFDPRTQRGFGPRCRAAIVLHEALHLFDERAIEPEIHVSEWDEPRFSAQAPDQAIHNPSAYASFAAQVHYERIDWPVDARFGMGRIAD